LNNATGQCPVVCPSHVDNDGTVARGVSTSRCPVVCPVVWFFLDQLELGLAVSLAMWGPYKSCTGHTGRCMNMHRPYWPPRPYTVYMAVLYTKQGAVKLLKKLMKSTHRPHRLSQQAHISRRTAQTSNTVWQPTRLQRWKWATFIQLTAGVCCILRLVQPVWPVRGSYTCRCGRCVVYMDRLCRRAIPLHVHCILVEHWL